MLAGRRADVAELNICGHVRAETAGCLDGPTLDVAGVPLRAGDKVMMLRNDRKIGVSNGNRGAVLDVDPDERTMRVRLARGDVEIPARYVDAGYVGLAYAMTVNKAHGMTCDATMMLGDDLLYRELAYEAMSRGRKENRIYMSRTTMTELDLRLGEGPHAATVEHDDPIDILAAGLERRRIEPPEKAPLLDPSVRRGYRVPGTPDGIGAQHALEMGNGVVTVLEVVELTAGRRAVVRIVSPPSDVPSTVSFELTPVDDGCATGITSSWSSHGGSAYGGATTERGERQPTRCSVVSGRFCRSHQHPHPLGHPHRPENDSASRRFCPGDRQPAFGDMRSARDSGMLSDHRALEGAATSELFALYRNILRELRARGVVRTENAPAGDYAEYLVARALDGVLAPNSEKSYDVMAHGARLQVTSRVVSNPPKSGQLQLSPFRSFDFDYAIIVHLDDADYRVRQAIRLPVGELRAVAVQYGHVNGHIVHARPALMASPAATDITSLLRAVT